MLKHSNLAYGLAVGRYHHSLDTTWPKVKDESPETGGEYLRGHVIRLLTGTTWEERSEGEEL